MLGLTEDTYVALVVVLAVAWFCRFAGYDDFALCSLRRRRPVESSQVHSLRQFQLLALPGWDVE